ncbi:MAG: hypothetical protein IPL08_03435 [Saprospiraceae bacterium]|nr:hypothetical protein [Saprospiraceae bacterium]MBK8667919.1 hypothetical protein [Saprospiraceae bacterium]
MKVFLYFSLMMTALFSTAFIQADKPATTEYCINVNGINLDFTLINQTGYDIASIYVAPTAEREWGEDIMGKDLLLDNESVEISFDGSETTRKWDMYVTWEGYESDEDRFWIGLDLSTISEITLYYDAKSGKTWAETK